MLITQERLFDPTTFTTQCALVPPNPNDDTPATGFAVKLKLVSSLVGIINGVAATDVCKCWFNFAPANKFVATLWCRMHTTAFNKPAMPAAPSK
jgi:hypothetical protein